MSDPYDRAAGAPFSSVFACSWGEWTYVLSIVYLSFLSFSRDLILPDSSPKCVQVPEYFEVIECPITVSSLLETLEAGLTPGEGDIVDMFIVSVRRMWEDCWTFNHEGTKVICSA